MVQYVRYYYCADPLQTNLRHYWSPEEEERRCAGHECIFIAICCGRLQHDGPCSTGEAKTCAPQQASLHGKSTVVCLFLPIPFGTFLGKVACRVFHDPLQPINPSPPPRLFLSSRKKGSNDNFAVHILRATLGLLVSVSVDLCLSLVGSSEPLTK